MNYEKLSTAYIDACREMLVIQPGPQMHRWPRWNSYMRLQRGQYTVFCGPTGSGKTQFLANLSAQLIETEIQQFVVSVETGRHDYVRRCMEAISTRRLTEFEPVPRSVLEMWHKEHGHLFAKDTMNVSLHESRVPVKNLIEEIDHQVQRYGCQVVVVDNLNYLLYIRRPQDAIHEMDEYTHALIEYTKKTPVHIIMVMHPRKTELDGRIESMYDIKGSSTAVQEAHNVLLFNRPREKDVKEGRVLRTDRELYFPKLRKRGWMAGQRLLFHCEAGVTYYLPGLPPHRAPGHQRGGIALLGGIAGRAPDGPGSGIQERVGAVLGAPPSDDRIEDYPGSVPGAPPASDPEVQN